MVEFARGIRVEEVNETERTIHGVFVSWAWHFHPDRHSGSIAIRMKQCLRRETAKVTMMRLCWSNHGREGKRRRGFYYSFIGTYMDRSRFRISLFRIGRKATICLSG